MNTLLKFIAYNISCISLLIFSAFMATHDHNGLGIVAFIVAVLGGIIPKTSDK